MKSGVFVQAVFSRFLATLVTFAGLAAQSPPAADAFERAGKHCVLVCHPGGFPEAAAAKLADQALASLEDFIPSLEKLLSVKVPALPRIHLHFRRVDMSKVVTDDTSPFLRDAVVDTKGEGHAALVPEILPQLVDQIGLPQYTAQCLRFAASEQAARILIPAGDEAQWMRQVVAMGVLETACNPKNLAGVDGGYDARRRFLLEFRRQGEEKQFAKLVQGIRGPGGREGYEFSLATAAVTAQVLASEKDWVKKFVGKPKPPAKGRALDRRQAAVAMVLGDDAAKIEARWQKIQRSVEARFLAIKPGFQPGSPRSLLVGTKEDACTVMVWTLPPAGAYTITSECEIGALDNGPFGKPVGMRLEGGVTDKTSFYVVLVPGRASLVEAGSDGKAVERAAAPAAIVAGKPFALRVEVDARELRLFLDGAVVISWAHGGAELHTKWFLHADQAPCWFSDLRMEPLGAAPPKK